MIRIRLNLRKVATIALCLAASTTMLAQSNTTDNDPLRIRGKESRSARKDREIGLSNVKELLYERGNIWANGYRLNNRQAQKVMSVNTEAFRLYNKGIKQKVGGNVLIGIGAPIFAGGLVYALMDWEGMGLDIENRAAMYSGLVIGGIGAGLLGGGITLAVIGNKSLRKSVNMFNNSSSKTSQVNLKMGLTGNGLGLVFNF